VLKKEGESALQQTNSRSRRPRDHAEKENASSVPCRLERERQAQERRCYQAKEVAGLSSGDHERDEALDVVPVARAFGQHPAAIGFGHSAEEKCTEVVVLDPCREESVATGC